MNEKQPPEAFLLSVLPTKWDFKVKNFDGDESNFTVVVRLDSLSSAKELSEWVKLFSEINKCVYRHKSTERNRTIATVYTEYYRCQHYIQPENGKCTKGTSCKSTIYASIKEGSDLTPRHSIIRINYKHNHEVNLRERQRYRTPDDNVKKVFEMLFENGSSPTDALNSYLFHSHLQTSISYNRLMSDRSKCPGKRLAYHWHKKCLPVDSWHEASERYARFARDWNAKSTTPVCWWQGDGENFTFLVCTRFMQRALRTTNVSQELMIDPVDNVKDGLKSTVMYIAVGEILVPVAVMVWTQWSRAGLRRALKLFMRNAIDMPSFGNGPQRIILGYDSVTAYNAVRSVFPHSKVYVRVEQLLKSCWTWLLAPERFVKAADQINLYPRFRRVARSTSEIESRDAFDALVADADDTLRAFANAWYARHDRWMGNGRSYADRVMLRDLRRKLHQSPYEEYARFVLTDFDQYYVWRLKNIESFSKIDDIAPLRDKYMIDRENELVIVTHKRKNVRYLVEHEIGVCSCYIGSIGDVCKHQKLVSEPNERTDSITKDIKSTLLFIVNSVSSYKDYGNSDPLSIYPFIFKDEKDDNVFLDDTESSRGSIEPRAEYPISATRPTNDLLQEFYEFAHLLEADETYYELGALAMTQQLRELRRSSPAARLSALHSFGKS